MCAGDRTITSFIFTCRNRCAPETPATIAKDEVHVACSLCCSARTLDATVVVTDPLTFLRDELGDLFMVTPRYIRTNQLICRALSAYLIHKS